MKSTNESKCFKCPNCKDEYVNFTACEEIDELQKDVEYAEEENRQMSIALVRINEIVDRHSNDASSSIQKLCAQIKLYSDEEQRQDGI
jgi:hypothetical protein